MPRACLSDFQARLVGIEGTRGRMEVLYGSGSIDQRDLDAVYEALFLRMVTGFEQFCEELFYAIIDRQIRYASSRQVSPRIRAEPEALREVLLARGDRNYLDWLPFNKATDRAGLFLVGGRPFSEVDDGQRSMIRRMTITRNAIAHSSKHANTEFLEKVIGELALLAEEKTPAGYLRSRPQGGTSSNRFQIWAIELVSVAAKLS